MDVNGFEQLLLAAHLSLATLTGIQELQLEDEEARELAKAAARVARHYDFDVAPKIMDLTMLGAVAGKIYLRRINLFMDRRRHAQPQTAPSDDEPHGVANGAAASGAEFVEITDFAGTA